jgi:hypothetical protein
MTDPPPRRDRRNLIDEAFDAVRANSAGKSRAEVEQLLRDELSARGIDFPDYLIRRAADVLAHPGGVLGKVRMLRFGIAALAELAAKANALSDLLTGADPGVGAVEDPADRASAWVEVILNADGKGVLRSRRARLGLLAHERDQVAVRLQRSETATAGTVVAAYVDDFWVGTLGHRHGLRYLPAISAARERGERGLLALGVSTVEPDAEPSLRIALTETAR